MSQATSVSAVPRRLQPSKAFQRLWVAGTLGAFFTALARTLPGDLYQLVHQFDGGFALNAALRYGYQLWLIWYFFLSNLRSQNDDPPKRREVFYDVVQSVCGLTAAYYLGFLVSPDPRDLINGIFHGVLAYLAPNAAILVICLLAFYLFRERHPELQTPRGLGAAIAFASMVLVILIDLYDWSVGYLLIPLVFLLWPLGKFHRSRVQDSNGSASPQAKTQKAQPASDAVTPTPAEGGLRTEDTAEVPKKNPPAS